MTKKLYKKEDIEVMSITKNSLNKSRIQELINFAKNSNFKRIGVANCFSMQKYADKLIEILKKENFEVFAMNCKVSGLKTGDIFNDNSVAPSCDPLSQAKYLNDNNTDLNINVGLCLGHGILFQQYSKVPVTTIIVKDFQTNHNIREELE
ncbi:MAG: DUF1847 domain-containing protein [Rickettsiales bacterium]|nr:DUF1847 domain-containing protein [Rickettsiales bacterium]